MFTRSLGWGRWNGYRSDLLRAARLAGDELRSWSGVEPGFHIAIDFSGDLAESSEDPATLETLHADDLARVRDLTLIVEPSREAWRDEYDRRAEGGEEPPEFISATVRFRLWSSSGLRVEVQGPNRTAVEGLAQRLGAILRPGAPRLHRIHPALAAFAVVGPLLLAGFVLGFTVPRWVGVAERNGKWETGEVVGITAGLVVAILIPFGIWRAFPTIEVLDDGQLPRHRRLRRVVLTACGGVALTLLGFLLDRL